MVPRHDKGSRTSELSHQARIPFRSASDQAPLTPALHRQKTARKNLRAERKAAHRDSAPLFQDIASSWATFLPFFTYTRLLEPAEIRRQALKNF